MPHASQLPAPQAPGARLPTPTATPATRVGSGASTDSLELRLEAEAGFLRHQVERGMSHRLRSVVEPEDVLQDVHLRILRSSSDLAFENIRCLRAWLAKVVQHCIIDLERRHFRTARRASQPRSLDDSRTGSSPLIAQLISQQRGPSSIARHTEDHGLLRRALVDLPPHQRRLLERVHFEHQRLTDIAAQEGRSPGAVRMQYARAVQACRRLVRHSEHGGAP